VSKIVAIHQPNFFPWLGYFNKIARADVFVVLDNVQFAKTGGTWSNRVRILREGRPAWATMPVERSYHGMRLVREMRVATGPWRVQLLRSIHAAYRGAPHVATVFPFVERLMSTPADFVAEFNLSVVRALSMRLALDGCELVVGSGLAVKGIGTERLVNIVLAVGGDTYLCGGGASGYQEDEKFATAGVRLQYQDFRHPVYPQLGSDAFVPGLSIIDVLMNSGFERTRQLIAGSSSESGTHQSSVVDRYHR
jgi:hypothetical protein